MQAAQRLEHRIGGRARAAGTDGRAEFREMFVSLVEPASLLDMERCRETSARMKEAAASAGYGAGAEMASLLGGIFEDATEIVNRPVDDGAMVYTSKVRYHMMKALYDTAVSYREGGDEEPFDRLRDAREASARLRRLAVLRAERMRAADPPGSGLPGIDRQYMGRICRDVEREGMEWVRAQRISRGEDPAFPPEREPFDCFEGCEGPAWSSVDIVNWAKGNGPPEGYEVVKVGDG